MSRKTLKKFIGEGASLLDDSNGADNLYDVLNELVEGVSDCVTAYQAVVATGIIGSIVVQRASTLRSLSASLAVCGTAGSTTLQVRVNGTSKGSLSWANTDPDPSYKTLSLDINVAAGDVVDLNVSAAPTGGTGLTATARVRPVIAE